MEGLDALAIAVVKALLVILFFMHLKDASRVAWVFCGCSFVWLGIMVVMTFQDYVTLPYAGTDADAGRATRALVAEDPD